MIYMLLFNIVAILVLFLLVLKSPLTTSDNSNPGKPWIIAHRGASGIYPENTYAAFDAAVKYGADFLELDLQLTKDGQLSVIHDPTLDRTTNGMGAVSDYSMGKLKSFDAGAWKDSRFKGERIPAFKDVLQRYLKQIGILIEVKPTENRAALAQELEILLRETLHPNSKPIIVQSFDEVFLLEFKKRMPEIPLGILIRHQPNGINKQTIRRLAGHFSFINPKVTMADAKLIRNIKVEGAECLIWTVNKKKTGQEVIAMNPQGIITNYPEWFS